MRSARLMLPALTAAAAGAGYVAGRRRTAGRRAPAADRLRLAARVDAALARAARDNGMLAVLMVDIDRFADVNHSLGHAHGDELLAQVEPRLRAAAGAHDVVVRLHGDVFAIVREDVDGPWDALAAAERLATALLSRRLAGVTPAPARDTVRRPGVENASGR